MLIPSLSARRSGAAVVAALAVVLTLFKAFPSIAQPATLSPVVVTGSREPMPLDRLVGDITVIDEQRIRKSSADSLETLLSREGGIQMSRSGGPGQTAGVFLRGSSSGNVVVLIDGVRIGSATTGQADLSSLSLASIERIEILRGPGSSLYGSDAVGGVVQIITKRGDGPTNVAAHLAVGQLKSSEADVSVSGATGDKNSGWDYALGLGREASDGVSALRPGDAFGNYNPDRDGFTRTHANLRGGFTFAPGQRIGASHQQGRTRAQYDGSEFLPAQDATPDFRSVLDTRVTALDYRGVFSPEWTSSVQLSNQLDDLVTGANAPDRFKTERRQLTWQNAWTPSPGQQFVGAIERLNESVESSSLSGGRERTNTALVVGYTGAFGAANEHKLQADVRHDRNSVYGNVNTGKLGWAMDVAPGLSVRAVAGTAFRGASFNDLYFPNFGVPTLRPERSRSVEVGVQWRDGEQQASATLFRNRVRDLIGYQPDFTLCPSVPPYPFGCAGNVSRARLQGATLTAAQRFGDFGVRTTVDFLDATDSDTGQRLVRRAAHQASVVADWTRGPWSLDATLTSVGARPEGGATLGAYETLDLQLRYRLDSSWQIESRLLNALDRDYQPARDYQSVGRQAWVGVRFQGAGL